MAVDAGRVAPACVVCRVCERVRERERGFERSRLGVSFASLETLYAAMRKVTPADGALCGARQHSLNLETLVETAELAAHEAVRASLVPSSSPRRRRVGRSETAAARVSLVGTELKTSLE